MVSGLSRLDGERETPAREAAYAALRQAILEGRLEPGERLVERDLAATLGISRTPVREALQKLEQERLVRKTPRRGMVVAGFSTREVNEIYQIRSALEGLVTSLAAERCTPERLRALEGLLVEMRLCIARSEPARYRQLHNRFNELIYQAAESPRLQSMLLQLREAVSRFSEFSYRVPGRIEEVQAEHEAIVAAIRSRNPEAAAAAARYHVHKSHETLLAVMSRLSQRE